MQKQASGTFDVQATSHPPYDTDEGATLRRATFTKQFQGDLIGTGSVEMISAVTEVQGSAAYVAIERIKGTLDGRTGSFVLAHTGVMTRGTPTLTVQVVPDSGTGGLRGLRGTLQIDIVEKQHFYRFAYDFDAA
jgi:hypothetical protein